MSQHTFVSKTQYDGHTFYLKLLWKQNDLDLFQLQILSDDGNSWSGTFSHGLARKYMDDLFQSEDQYYSNTKKCLIGESSNEFRIEIKVGDDTTTILWKKRFEDLFQVQGSLTLNRDDISETKDTLIDYLLDDNKELRSSIANMDQQTEEINTELTKCKSELEKFVNMKTLVEATLYGKFVQLLNTKKQRIQSLEEQLKKCRN